MTEDGTVIVSWIESPDGWDKAATYVARLGERGTRVQNTLKLDGDTCVCCRVDATTGPKNIVFVVVWHEEPFPVTKTVIQPIHLSDTR